MDPSPLHSSKFTMKCVYLLTLVTCIGELFLHRYPRINSSLRSMSNTMNLLSSLVNLFVPHIVDAVSLKRKRSLSSSLWTNLDTFCWVIIISDILQIIGIWYIYSVLQSDLSIRSCL
jgi:hypothetical protein